MSDMTISNKNIHHDYPPSSTQASTEKKESSAKTETVLAEKKEVMDIETLINQDPKLKAIFNQVVASFSQNSPEEQFNINRVIASLIDLNQALQGAATAYADRLSKITEKLTAYTKLQTQIPVIIKGKGIYEGDKDEDRSARADVNQKFANMLEAIRANKGLEEDKAKKVQTLMQSLKDAGTSASDFVSSFIDLIRGVGSKITQ